MKLLIGMFIFIISLPCQSENFFTDGEVNTFELLLGTNDRLNDQSIQILAKNKMIILDRFRYREVGKNSWRKLKSQNKNLKVLLFQSGPKIKKHTDEDSVEYINNISRYENSRGHSQGALVDNKEFFLLSKNGKKVSVLKKPDSVLMDFGNIFFQKYWLEATMTDIVNKDWVADGVFIDASFPYHQNNHGWRVCKNLYNYDDAEDWNPSMNNFIFNISQGMGRANQITMFNRGHTKREEGVRAWVDLDRKGHEPAIMMEEGAFVVSWGVGDAQFIKGNEWLRQVMLPQQIEHSSIAFASHIDIHMNEFGRTAFGRSFKGRQAFRYAFASYLLAKRKNGKPSFFYFEHDRKKNGQFNKISWQKIYGELGIGLPKNDLYIQEKKNAIYYRRDFENGYVLVNPNKTAVIDLKIDKGYINLFEEFKNNAQELINIQGFDAVIFRKSLKESNK